MFLMDFIFVYIIILFLIAAKELKEKIQKWKIDKLQELSHKSQ